MIAVVGPGAAAIWVEPVLAFWYAELRPKDWWSAAPRIDAAIRARFGPLHEALARQVPDAGALDGRGHLAAILVFDQFPRNLYRGSAKAFATDGLALGFASDAIDRHLDAGLAVAERQFLYMPLMHSEDRSVQQRSLTQFARLGDARALRSARSHQSEIARFGRFPARNAALGRASTQEEAAFLARKPDARTAN